MGALHPEIQPGQKGDARILCARCRTEADTAGHRFWRCPATRALRDQMFPNGIPLRAPIVLTRFGVVPAGYSKHEAQCIQRYLVKAVRATSVFTANTQLQVQV